MQQFVRRQRRRKRFNIINIEDLVRNPEAYANKMVAIQGMLWAEQSYEDYACGMMGDLGGHPCILKNGPYNPSCEFIIQINGTVSACVPRSKVQFLARAHVGEQVTVIGTVDHRVTNGAIPWLQDAVVVVFLPNGKTRE